MTRYHITRRTLLHQGSRYLLAAGVGGSAVSEVLAAKEDAKPAVRFGMVTDLHHADKNPAGSRHYRESLTKLAEAAEAFEKAKPAFVVELGDFIDRAKSVETELTYLKRAHKDFAKLPGDQHYVLGNHCVDTLTKEEFLSTVGQEKSYYSFDEGGVHFIVLDACFTSEGKSYGRNNSKWDDANIPAKELAWLADDLKQNARPTVVFAHQRLDADDRHTTKNAPEVRKLLEASGNVLAVFQGHSHKNDHRLINGIHYCVHRAMVEGKGEADNGYSTLDVFADGTIKMTGFRKQSDYAW